MPETSPLTPVHSVTHYGEATFLTLAPWYEKPFIYQLKFLNLTHVMVQDLHYRVRSSPPWSLRGSASSDHSHLGLWYRQAVTCIVSWTVQAFCTSGDFIIAPIRSGLITNAGFKTPGAFISLAVGSHSYRSEGILCQLQNTPD